MTEVFHVRVVVVIIALDEKMERNRRIQSSGNGESHFGKLRKRL